MAKRSERQWVERLRERFASTAPGVALGIGDDAAILSGQGGDWVCSVDASVEGVHFDRRFLSLRDVGYRSFQAAASDLAAMGAVPVAALSALILPAGLPAADLDELTLGQRDASLECQCPLVGGNIARGQELSVTTTVLGSVQRPLPRGGARPGEQLWLVGEVGLAAAGLAALRLPQATAERAELAGCVRAWRRPRALLAQGQELARLASSAIDVSDGLASDAQQLARASRVRLVVSREQLRAALAPGLLAGSRVLRRAALPFALFGGEDYALLATGPSTRRPPWATAIGWVARGQGVLLDLGGWAMPIAGGYDHLAC